MSDGVKLEACPLCGREPEINRHAVFQIHCTQTYPGQHIVCVTERTEAEAIAAWNTRKSDDGWRTMESAPKDTHILVWGEAVRWRGVGGLTIGYRHSDERDDRIALDGRCGTRFSTAEVTHWRPLPSPPEG